MRWLGYGMIGWAGIIAVAGCRTATKIVEVPRVDLEVSHATGNRGYVVGTPPSAEPWKTTRQMVRTDIEIPSLYAPTRASKPVDFGTVAPSEAELPAGTIAVPVRPATSQASGKHDTYVVQKGDSLWSIAAKPNVYGKASKWRRILEANTDVLKGNPDRLKVGMTLNIPRGDDGGGSSTTYDDEGITYKK